MNPVNRLIVFTLSLCSAQLFANSNKHHFDKEDETACNETITLSATTNTFKLVHEYNSYTAKYRLCEGSSVALKLEGVIPDEIKWFRESAEISSATDSILTDQPGVYSAQVKKGQCTYASPKIEVITLNRIEVKVWPKGFDSGVNELIICTDGGFAELIKQDLELGAQSSSWSWQLNGSNLLQKHDDKLLVESGGNYSLVGQMDDCPVISNTVKIREGEKPTFTYSFFGYSEEVKERGICSFNVEGSVVIQASSAVDMPVLYEGKDLITLRASKYGQAGAFVSEFGEYSIIYTQGSCAVYDTLRIKQSNYVQTSLSYSGYLNESTCQSSLILDSGLEFRTYSEGNHFRWFYNDNQINKNSSLTNIVDKAGVYYFSGSNIDYNCKYESDTIEITEPEFGKKYLRFTESGTIRLCEGETYTLMLNRTGGKVRWFKDGKSINTTPLSYLNVKEEGSYWAELILFDCTLVSDTIQIQHIPAPKISLSSQCDAGNKLITLEANTLGNQAILKWSWLKNGLGLHEQGNKITISESGTYTVFGEGQQCPSNSSSLIAGLTIAETKEKCAGFEYAYEANPEEISSNVFSKFYWLDSNQKPISESHSLVYNVRNFAGSRISLISEMEGGCSINQKVTIATKDWVNFEFPDTITYAAGEYFDTIPQGYSLTDSTENLKNYTFQSPSGSPVNLLGQMLTPEMTGKYSVTGSNGYYGCPVIRTFELVVSKKSIPKSLKLDEIDDSFLCNLDLKTITFQRQGPEASEGIVRGKIDFFDFNGLLLASLSSTTESNEIQFDLAGLSIPDFIILSLRIDGKDELVAQTIVKRKPLHNLKYSIIGSSVLCNRAIITIYDKNATNIQWFKNGESIENEFGRILNVNEEGTYSASFDYSAEFLAKINGTCSTAKPLEIVFENTKQLSIRTYNDCQSPEMLLRISENLENDSLVWKKNGGAIPELAGKREVYVPKENASYTVESSGSSCITPSEPIILKPRQYYAAEIGYVYDSLKGSFGYTPLISSQFTGCRGQSIALQPLYINNGSNIKSLVSSIDSIVWFQNNKLLEGNNRKLDVNKSGVYQAIVFDGSCEYNSNTFEVVLEDTIFSRFDDNRLLRRELCYGSSTTLGASLLDFTDHGNRIRSGFGFKWFKNDSAYRKAEYDLNVTNLLYPVSVATAGVYRFEGYIQTEDSNICYVKSDKINVVFKDTLDYAGNSNPTKIETLASCSESIQIPEINNVFDAHFTDSYVYKDGLPYSAFSPSFRATEPGLYSILANHKEMCVMEMAKYYITLGSGKAMLTTSNGLNYQCEEDYIELSALVSPEVDGKSLRFDWYKDEVLIEGGVKKNRILATPGQYRVVFRADNCSGESQIFKIEDGRIPNLEIANDSAYLCNGQPFSLENLTNKNYGYTWYKNGIILGNELSEFNEEGLYQALIKNRFCIKKTPVISVSNIPVNQQTKLIGKSILCPEETAVLKGINQSGFNYLLEKDDKIVDNNRDAEFQLSESGAYKILYQKGTCKVSSSSVNIKKVFETEILTDTKELCPNETTDLLAYDNDSLEYQWFYNNQPIDGGLNSVLNVGDAGEYFVQINGMGCKAFSDTLLIVQHESSTAFLSGSQVISFGDTANVSVSLVGTAAPWEVELSDGQILTINTSYYELPVSPLQTTTYTITSFNDVCGAGTVSGEAKITVLVLGTNDELVKTQVYPNPASEFIFLKTEKEELEKLSLYDLTGKLIPQKMHAEQDGYLLDIRSLNAGTYLLKIDQGNQTKTFQIIKN